MHHIVLCHSHFHQRLGELNLRIQRLDISLNILEAKVRQLLSKYTHTRIMLLCGVCVNDCMCVNSVIWCR